MSPYEVLLFQLATPFETRIACQLPSYLSYRLNGIVSREMARFLWNSKTTYKLDHASIRELKRILHSLRSEEWSIPIPHMIPRDHHFASAGDASLLGGGALSLELDYWFRIVWSLEVRAATKLPPSDPRYIHINTLEFLVAFMQAIVVVVMLESGVLPSRLRDLFPHGLPIFPILRNGTDNTSTLKWINNCRTNSPLARALVSLYGQLLRRSPLTSVSVHIPGEDNIVPDWISRPDSLSPERLLSQMSIKFPWMRDLRYFQPSAELLSVLNSALLCSSSQEPLSLPENLGQFVPAGSISSAFCVL